MKHSKVMYGGAFNPPHRDHTGIVSALLDSVADRVLVIPTGARDDKDYGGVSSSERLQMLRLATEDFGDRVEIDTRYLFGDESTTTVGQAAYLRAKFGHDIPQVFWSDTAARMMVWDPTGFVAHRLPKIFVSRPGYAIPDGTVSNFETVEFQSAGFSSTDVRNEVSTILKQRAPIDHLLSMVHEKVAWFLVSRSLYIAS